MSYREFQLQVFLEKSLSLDCRSLQLEWPQNGSIEKNDFLYLVFLLLYINLPNILNILKLTFGGRWSASNQTHHYQTTLSSVNQDLQPVLVKEQERMSKELQTIGKKRYRRRILYFLKFFSFQSSFI